MEDKFEKGRRSKRPESSDNFALVSSPPAPSTSTTSTSTAAITPTITHILQRPASSLAGPSFHPSSQVVIPTQADIASPAHPTLKPSSLRPKQKPKRSTTTLSSPTLNYISSGSVNASNKSGSTSTPVAGVDASSAEGQGKERKQSSVASSNSILSMILPKDQFERGRIPEPGRASHRARSQPSRPTPLPNPTPLNGGHPGSIQENIRHKSLTRDSRRRAPSPATSQHGQDPLNAFTPDDHPGLAKVSQFAFVKHMGDKYLFQNPLPVLGRGTYGVVLRAEAKRTRAVVAMKAAPAGSSNLELDILQDLKKGIDAKELGYENVLELLDWKTVDGITYTVTAIANGPTMWTVMDKAPSPLIEPVVWHVGGKALMALLFLHRRGGIHRDVGPNNFMFHHDSKAFDFMDESLGVKLIDYGQSANPRLKGRHLDAVKVFGGTDYFKAPEVLIQGNGDKPHGQPVDMASFGILLCYMLTKFVPTIHGEPQGKLDEHKKRRYSLEQVTGAFEKMIEVLAPHISAKGLELMKGLLTIDPQERWTSERAALEWPTGPLIPVPSLLVSSPPASSPPSTEPTRHDVVATALPDPDSQAPAPPSLAASTPTTATTSSIPPKSGNSSADTLQEFDFQTDTENCYELTSPPRLLGSYGAIATADDVRTGEPVVITAWKRTSADDRGDPMLRLTLFEKLRAYTDEVDDRTEGSGGENVVRLDDFYSTDSLIYIITATCEGGSLWDLVKKDGRMLSDVETWRYGRDLLRAITFIRKCPGFFVVLDLDPRGFCFTSKDLEAPETKGILAEFGNTIVSVVDGTDVEGIVDSECLEAVRPVDRIQDSRDDGLAVAAMLLFMITGEEVERDTPVGKQSTKSRQDRQERDRVRLHELMMKSENRIWPGGLRLLKGLLDADAARRWSIEKAAMLWPPATEDVAEEPDTPRSRPLKRTRGARKSDVDGSPTKKSCLDPKSDQLETE